MARLKIDKTTLDLQVKIRDCWVLVGPYPLYTQTSAAATGMFEGGVGNQTRLIAHNTLTPAKNIWLTPARHHSEYTVNGPTHCGHRPESSYGSRSPYSLEQGSLFGTVWFSSRQ
jgi:hypothetical protein